MFLGLLWTAAVFQSDDAAQALGLPACSAYGQLPDGALDIADLPDQLRWLLANDTSQSSCRDRGASSRPRSMGNHEG